MMNASLARTINYGPVLVREVSQDRYEVIRPEMTLDLFSCMMTLNARFKALGFNVTPNAGQLDDGRIVTVYHR